MKRSTPSTLVLMVFALTIATPRLGCPAESPTIEKAALTRTDPVDQRYLYVFDFDFVNHLSQPIEIISVSASDIHGNTVEQNWAARGPNWDQRLMTHALSGDHPLVKIISKPRGTPLEQATVTPVGDRIELKVTNRILSAGDAIRPSLYLLSSKNKYDSLVLGVAYRLNGNLQEVRRTFNVSHPSVDWRNTRYTLGCAGDDRCAASVDVRDGHAERFTRDRDGNTVDGCIVDVQSVTPPQDLTGDAKPETAVLLSCSPQPSNYFNQEVQVFNEDSKLLATLKDLGPLPNGLGLAPVFNPSEFSIRDGKLVTGIRYYADTDSHASRPSIHRVLAWHWNGQGFEPTEAPGEQATQMPAVVRVPTTATFTAPFSQYVRSFSHSPEAPTPDQAACSGWSSFVRIETDKRTGLIGYSAFAWGGFCSHYNVLFGGNNAPAQQATAESLLGDSFTAPVSGTYRISADIELHGNGTANAGDGALDVIQEFVPGPVGTAIGLANPAKLFPSAASAQNDLVLRVGTIDIANPKGGFPGFRNIAVSFLHDTQDETFTGTQTLTTHISLNAGEKVVLLSGLKTNIKAWGNASVVVRPLDSNLTKIVVALITQ